MKLTVEFDREEGDGRWMASVPDVSGTHAYGDTPFHPAGEAIASVLSPGEDGFTWLQAAAGQNELRLRFRLAMKRQWHRKLCEAALESNVVGALRNAATGRAS